MGNKLSACSCAPLSKQRYRDEDSPWQTGGRGALVGSGSHRGDSGPMLRCGSVIEKKRCAYHAIQPFHSIIYYLIHPRSKKKKQKRKLYPYK